MASEVLSELAEDLVTEVVHIKIWDPSLYFLLPEEETDSPGLLLAQHVVGSVKSLVIMSVTIMG